MINSLFNNLAVSVLNRHRRIKQTIKKVLYQKLFLLNNETLLIDKTMKSFI